MNHKMPIKPLGQKAYGSIGHLPGSRMGAGDHHITEGQARIATQKRRDANDLIIVQEKLDGSCTSVAKVNGICVALGRAGWPAASSPYEQHRLFDKWVWDNYSRFDTLLDEGERVVGEWLAQAHGTRYALNHEPWVCFDLMRGTSRATYQELISRTGDFITPFTLHQGYPIGVEIVMRQLGQGKHGALDPIEGAVWRVERKGKVDFLCKYVRPDKVDGYYLPEITGVEPVWNWRA